MNTNKKVLSLFSGCGGMDIGIEGGFKCIRRMVNEYEHSEWIEEIQGNLVTLKETGFKTIFANDIRPDAKSAWVSYFSKRINAKIRFTRRNFSYWNTC